MMALFTTAASAQQSTVVATQADGAGLLPEFNRWRTAIGIRPYSEDTRLTQAAQFHSDDQVARNYFNHDAPRPVACNGKSVSDLGQRAACFGTFVSGEGIAKGQQTADEATRGWLHSPGHCLGVMDSTATHMGGGHAGDIWTFMYNGVNVPAPNPDFRAFCTCTCTSSSDGSEAALQACVVKFNNGVVPVAPPPSSLQLSYQLPNATGSYNNRCNPDGSVVRQFTAAADQTEIVIDPVNPADSGTTDTTAAADECNPTVTSTDEMVNAINKANDEAACPGANTLFLVSDITVAAGYEGGANAFPVITTDITINSMNRIISRDASAPAFRFFYVDGTAGKAGALTLTDIQLTGGDAGEALDGGAIFVDARDGGKSALHVRNGAFINNKGNGNGGAIMTLSINGGQVDLVVEDSTFDGNVGVYGGAIYSGGFDGGNATATITNTNFTNNSAQEGGTIYNNGLGANGHAHMSLTDVTLSSSTSPRNDAIHNNGRAAGDAALTLTGNLLGGTGLSLGAPGIIFNQGTEGSAVTTWKDQTAGSAENVCIGVSETGTDLSVVPCP